jgi:hypothetical protein
VTPIFLPSRGRMGDGPDRQPESPGGAAIIDGFAAPQVLQNTEPLCAVRGTLAQLVEQRTFNPLVAGSNPARPTNTDMQSLLFNR